MPPLPTHTSATTLVSVLFNEPKLLKLYGVVARDSDRTVSVLFNEPKLLKSWQAQPSRLQVYRFSTLQRAEIAEIEPEELTKRELVSFSTLQRAEIAEILRGKIGDSLRKKFQYSSTSRNC